AARLQEEPTGTAQRARAGAPQAPRRQGRPGARDPRRRPRARGQGAARVPQAGPGRGRGRERREEAQARHHPPGGERDHRVPGADRRVERDAARPEIGPAHAGAPPPRQGRHHRARGRQVGSTDPAGEIAMADPKETEAQDNQGTPDPGATPPTPAAAADPAAPPQRERAPRKEKKAKKPAEGERGAAREPAGPPPPPAEPAPRPRLLDYYEQRVRAKLAQQFGFGNAHQIPKLVKIVVNVGMGDAPKNPKGLEAAVAELAAITGQRPVVTRAKKAIANFNLREGQAIGCAVTLRGARMYEFLDRFISIAVPRMRDFRGLPTKSF